MKFKGKVGYGEQVEVRAGVYQDVITERELTGDVVRDTVQSTPNDGTVNNDLTLGNSLSVVASSIPGELFHAIRYVEWEGVCWRVVNVTRQPPRLLLRLGGVYVGSRPTP